MPSLFHVVKKMLPRKRRKSMEKDERRRKKWVGVGWEGGMMWAHCHCSLSWWMLRHCELTAVPTCPSTYKLVTRWLEMNYELINPKGVWTKWNFIKTGRVSEQIPPITLTCPSSSVPQTTISDLTTINGKIQ
jgi:hypothetical protein